MFLQNVSYDTLSVLRTFIVIIFLIIMFVATLREKRRWLNLTYALLGLTLTIVCILIIPKEVASGISHRMSIIIGVVAAVCTSVWAVLFGKNTKEYIENEEETEEEA